MHRTLNSDQEAIRKAGLARFLLSGKSLKFWWQIVQTDLEISWCACESSCWLSQHAGLGTCLVQEHPLVALPAPLLGRVLLAPTLGMAPDGFWWWEKAGFVEAQQSELRTATFRPPRLVSLVTCLNLTLGLQHSP